MSYIVKLHSQVDKFLNKCSMDLRERIKNKLRLLQDDPFLYLEHYEGQDFYKLRVGNYRALIDIDTERRIVFVRYLDHRKRIYKRLK